MRPLVIVQKYGGACLETPEKMRDVARSLARQYTEGHRLVVIVSAIGKTTDELVRKAYQVSPNPNRREMDMLLTTGERISMALLSMALADNGVPAISFTGSQAGVMTDDSHSSARIVDVRPIRVREELERGRLVVLAGFQGVNPHSKEITTLGRGGSDTTAVAMAASLQADYCEIIKEVDGICSADPRLVPEAKTLKQVAFKNLAEMCFWGAKVLHFRSVELAHQQNVPLVIKRLGENPPCTHVLKEVTPMESGKVLAINSIAQVEQVEIDCENLNQGLEVLSRHLSEHTLPWPQLISSTFSDGQCLVLLTSDPESLETLLRSLSKGKHLRRHRETLSSVSVTCFGGVASNLPHRILQILSAREVVVEKCVHSPFSLTVFIAPAAREVAVKALHQLI